MRKLDAVWRWRNNYGSLLCPELPEVSWGAFSKHPYPVQFMAVLMGHQMCCTCGSIRYTIPKDYLAKNERQISPTPRPWETNDSFALDHKTTYCKCGSVFCYECNPPLDKNKKKITRRRSTEHDRLMIECQFCDSLPMARKEANKVCCFMMKHVQTYINIVKHVKTYINILRLNGILLLVF